ncbi:MAG TPA: F0F1 ATP synthase subunit B [Patescibacteria group bacterium]|nr:F0F1 ATP synthase subunit B [Patescibacteria group bacterium]
MHESIVDLNLNMWTIFFTLFNAMVLYIILRRLLFLPVMNFIDQRKSTIMNEIAIADNLKSEAHALRDEYNNRLADIDGEKKVIIDEARKMSGYIYEKGKKEAEKEKERILKSAETERKHLYEKAREDLKKETAIISIDIAEEILKKKIDSSANRQILDSIIDELSNVKV